jgi:uncharacterized damage-inducible protein DinB
MDRRRFLKTSGALACGFTGTAIGLPALAGAADAQPSNAGRNIIGPREGYPPHIGTLISMLNYMRAVVLDSVTGLQLAQLDYLHDAKANTIGALLNHLAAIERLYQVHTFEGKKWGDWDEPTKKQWEAAAALGPAARKKIKANQLAFYLDMLGEVREHTLAELRKRDDEWLMRVDPAGFGGEPTNNYCKWFHVCEHESNHNGQIKWLKARLPA